MLLVFAPKGVRAEALSEVISAAEVRVFNGNELAARRQALSNAQRRAIEIRLATFLGTVDLSRHRSFLQEKIKQQQASLAPRQKILREERRNNNWHVLTRTQVSDAELSKLLKTLRISKPQLLGRSLTIICLGKKTKETRLAVRNLKQLLTGAGAWVQENRLLAREEEEESLTEAQIRLLNLAHTPLVLLCEPSIKTSDTSGISRSQAIVKLRLIEAHNESSQSERQNKRWLADGTISTSLLHRAKTDPSPAELAQLMTLATQLGIQNILLQLRLGKSKQRLYDLLLSFKGFDESAQKTILGWFAKHQTLNRLTLLETNEESFQLQLFSSDSPSQVRRSVDIGLRRQGLLPRIHPLLGNQISFSNARNHEQ